VKEPADGITRRASVARRADAIPLDARRDESGWMLDAHPAEDAAEGAATDARQDVVDRVRRAAVGGCAAAGSTDDQSVDRWI
jgi:hypothetical protein